MKDIDINVLQRFPSEPRPFEHEGNKFVVMVEYYADDFGLYAGDVVTLKRNDGSLCPLFDVNGLYLPWHILAELPKENGA